MKKKLYETPRTQHVEVELEEGVMTGGSVFLDKEDSKGLKIEDHRVDETFDFSKNDWD
ncbi:hypothetical protein H6A61_08085 [Bacteroides caecigallinarum]|uniref:hypothetical protein n=1 Tax=Bacteroides caecigallinarum TaxID=1411144 RepID=UPI00195801A5|nr:hypothetical protein [Bacteroides caecigallinarum]MBM6960804.1 hypothetical protein [Bacteroides caecigallinarum]